MPEEIEVPTEHLHEHMEHSAEETGQRWVLGVALSSALLAGFAAVAALLAGHNANEAMLDQIKASDQWNYYQAKGIKAAVLNSKIELLRGEHHTPSKLKHHENLAFAVTFFQVAIAVGAISALARRRAFWLVSLGFGVVGLVFLSLGLL